MHLLRPCLLLALCWHATCEVRQTSNITSVCSFNCTSSSGGACKYSSGYINAGVSSQHVCQTGSFAVASPGYCIPNNTTMWSIVCTTDSSLIPASSFISVASEFPAYSIPASGFCNCAPSVVYPSCSRTNTNSPYCSSCALSCNTWQRSAKEVAAGSSRQSLTASQAVFCPATITTLDEAFDCFKQAACLGRVSPLDTCVYSVNGASGGLTHPCPDCSSGSKKGLYGLFALLALIPLILCSVVLCCIFCMFKPKKTDEPQLVATFNNPQGMPSLPPPIPMCAPGTVTAPSLHGGALTYTPVNAVTAGGPSIF
eukprot:TRINITY_DN572_c0_g1_i1.p1 TRINITY_DN572_c0_g1~~TRINITY_DN572_c0_g1_i1.p1  ORF type:complete len:312 (+),score=37.85 TRINITY_DN572_c0_g1_i1:154-1089(+)